jgi:hypothetical protein
MSDLLDYQQTSGNDWSTVRTGLLYHEFQETGDAPAPRLQLADFIHLEEQMVRFQADHEALISELRKHYILESGPSVEEFFRNHRTLPQLLNQAVPILRLRFGDTVFILRVTADEYGWQTLYVVAIWPGKAHDALAAIDEFEDAWWIANSHSASGSLNFTYQLV